MRVRYVSLENPANTHSLGGEVGRAVTDLAPQRIKLVRPGEHRVLQEIQSSASRLGTDLELLEDDHFVTDLGDFAAWMEGRKRPVMDHFYRQQRRRLNVLMSGGKPIGGAWSLDAENRDSFREAPSPPPPPRFRPSRTTRKVLDLVRRSFPAAPGTLDHFPWPVTRKQALRALEDFVENRLPHFGRFQDAMWTQQPFLYHSLLSPALNLKLLNPRELIKAAVAAFEEDKAPLNSVEGFVRQVVGWREFIRGVYWAEGPDYGARNALGQTGNLPELYWTGETDMACMRDAVGQVLRYGYGHHIQRLMVTGNFALIAGVAPRAISDWYLGMYVDAVDWATLPNTLGMVMHADGGVVGTKPYAASGRYINRMSNYCSGCRYDPAKRTGPDACPFTTFYWDFLARNRERFADNPRMTMMLRNVERLDRGEKQQITKRANRLRAELGVVQ
jgi:deoxyribodipyrimidine photolyase-related protein